VDKASLDNEQNAVLISDEKNREILMIQIAGWVARRIVCYLRKNYWVERGVRFGLIRFGSRVDVYLPQDAVLNIKNGDAVQGGASILARLK
jgi:phosphatidylserine decarboxylase